MSEGYSYDLRRLQLTELQILKEFIRVCEKHGFRFYIICGTCLGAVRHGGFIPWDDDIDVCMYAEDFDRFIRCGADFGEQYFLQTIETEPEFKTMIARIRLNGTTILEKDYLEADIHQGVFIDVYPLFGYPSDPVRAQFRSWESLLYRMLLLEEAPRNHGKAVKVIGSMAYKLIPTPLRRHLVSSIHRKLRSDPDDTDYVALLYGMDVGLFHTIRYKRSWFEDPTMVRFEDMTLPAPSDVDSYLKERYGDYMKLPPADKQNSYHSFEFVDLDNSYEIYKGKRYLMENRNVSR